MADDQSMVGLLFQLEADSTGVRVGTQDAANAVAQLRARFGTDMGQLQSVGLGALNHLGDAVTSFVSQKLPLLGRGIQSIIGSFVSLAGGAGAVGAEMTALQSSIEGISKESGISSGAVAGFLTQFVTMETQLERDAFALQFFNQNAAKVGPEVAKATTQLKELSLASGKTAEEVFRVVTPTSLIVITLAGLGVAIAGVISGLVALGNKVAAYGEEIFKAHLKTRVGFETLGALSEAAQEAGESFAGLSIGLIRFGRNVDLAAKGNERLAEQLRSQGITTFSSVDAALVQFIEHFGKLATEEEQAAAAGEVFGSRFGPRLVTVFNAVGGNMTAFIAKLKESGQLLSEEQVRAAHEAAVAHRQLESAFDALGRQLGASVLPAITTVTQAIAEYPKTFIAIASALGLVVAAITLAQFPALGAGLLSVGKTAVAVTQAMFGLAAATQTAAISANVLAAAWGGLIVAGAAIIYLIATSYTTASEQAKAITAELAAENLKAATSARALQESLREAAREEEGSVAQHEKLNEIIKALDPTTKAYIESLDDQAYKHRAVAEAIEEEITATEDVAAARAIIITSELVRQYERERVAAEELKKARDQLLVAKETGVTPFGFSIEGLAKGVKTADDALKGIQREIDANEKKLGTLTQAANVSTVGFLDMADAASNANAATANQSPILERLFGVYQRFTPQLTTSTDKLREQAAAWDRLRSSLLGGPLVLEDFLNTTGEAGVKRTQEQINATKEAIRQTEIGFQITKRRIDEERAADEARLKAGRISSDLAIETEKVRLKTLSTSRQADLEEAIRLEIDAAQRITGTQEAQAAARLASDTKLASLNRELLDEQSKLKTDLIKKDSELEENARKLSIQAEAARTQKLLDALEVRRQANANYFQNGRIQQEEFQEEQARLSRIEIAIRQGQLAVEVGINNDRIKEGRRVAAELLRIAEESKPKIIAPTGVPEGLKLEKLFDFAPDAASKKFQQNLNRVLNNPEVQKIVQDASDKFKDVPKALINAVIAQESGLANLSRDAAGRLIETSKSFDEQGRVIAMGAMQFIRGTANEYGLFGDKVYDVQANIAAGTKYIHDLLKLTGGDVAEALIGYNAGLTNFRTKWNSTLSRIPAETKGYLREIGGALKQALTVDADTGVKNLEDTFNKLNALIAKAVPAAERQRVLDELKLLSGAFGETLATGTQAGIARFESVLPQLDATLAKLRTSINRAIKPEDREQLLTQLTEIGDVLRDTLADSTNAGVEKFEAALVKFRDLVGTAVGPQEQQRLLTELAELGSTFKKNIAGDAEAGAEKLNVALTKLRALISTAIRPQDRAPLIVELAVVGEALKDRLSASAEAGIGKLESALTKIRTLISTAIPSQQSSQLAGELEAISTELRTTLGLGVELGAERLDAALVKFRALINRAVNPADRDRLLSDLGTIGAALRETLSVAPVDTTRFEASLTKLTGLIATAADSRGRERLQVELTAIGETLRGQLSADVEAGNARLATAFTKFKALIQEAIDPQTSAQLTVELDQIGTVLRETLASNTETGTVKFEAALAKFRDALSKAVGPNQRAKLVTDFVALGTTLKENVTADTQAGIVRLDAILTRLSTLIGTVVKPADRERLTTELGGLGKVLRETVSIDAEAGVSKLDTVLTRLRNLLGRPIGSKERKQLVDDLAAIGGSLRETLGKSAETGNERLEAAFTKLRATIGKGLDSKKFLAELAPLEKALKETFNVGPVVDLKAQEAVMKRFADLLNITPDPTKREEFYATLRALNNKSVLDEKAAEQQRIENQRSAAREAQDIAIKAAQQRLQIGAIRDEVAIANIQAQVKLRIKSEEDAARAILKIQLDRNRAEQEALGKQREGITETTHPVEKERLAAQEEITKQINILVERAVQIQADGTRRIGESILTDLQNRLAYYTQLRGLDQEALKLIHDREKAELQELINREGLNKRTVAQARKLALDEEDMLHGRIDNEIDAQEARLRAVSAGGKLTLEAEQRINRLRELEDQRHKKRTGEIPTEKPKDVVVGIGLTVDKKDNPFEDIQNEIDKMDGSMQTLAQGGLDAAIQGFSLLGQAVGAAVHAFVLYGSAGTNVRKVTAEILASIAQQAAVKAIWELAEGFAALALGWLVPANFGSAASHFKAAALYGIIAGVAAGAGRAAAGGSFQQSAGAGTSTTGGTSPTTRPTEQREPHPERPGDPNFLGRRISGQQAPSLPVRFEGQPQIVRPEVHLHVHGDATEAFNFRITDVVVQDYRNNGPMRKLVNNETF